MKQDAIDTFANAIKQDLLNNFPVVAEATPENMYERVTRMHEFISMADAKYADLYFSLLDLHDDLSEEDLDEVLLNETKGHFGV